MIKFTRIVKKILKEDVSLTPEKANEVFTKYKTDFPTYQTQAERMYNIMENFTIGDLLEPNGESKISKFSDTANALYNKLSDIWEKLINLVDHNENLEDEANDLASKYKSLYDHLFRMYDFTHEFYNIKEKLDEDELKDLVQYKKQ